MRWDICGQSSGNRIPSANLWGCVGVAAGNRRGGGKSESCGDAAAGGPACNRWGIFWIPAGIGGNLRGTCGAAAGNRGMGILRGSGGADFGAAVGNGEKWESYGEALGDFRGSCGESADKRWGIGIPWGSGVGAAGGGAPLGNRWGICGAPGGVGGNSRESCGVAAGKRRGCGG